MRVGLHYTHMHKALAFKNFQWTLAIVAQVVGDSSHNQKVGGLIPGPGAGGCYPWSDIQSLVWARLGVNKSLLFSCIDDSIFLPHSFPLSLKAIKNVLG